MNPCRISLPRRNVFAVGDVGPAMGVVFSLLGVTLALASWAVYMAAIARERVPPQPWGHVATQVTAMVASIAGVLVGWGSTPALAIASVALSVPLALLFLWLLSEAPVPDAAIRVAVGQPLLPFTARTSDGATWSTDRLRERRVLLKFFRGGW